MGTHRQRMAREDFDVLTKQLINANVVKLIGLNKLDEVVHRNFGLCVYENIVDERDLEFDFVFVRNSQLVEVLEESLHGMMRIGLVR